MNLLQMSFSGGILILAVIVLRALALNRLPKRTFLALWAAAAVRLLVPFRFASPVGLYSLKAAPPPRTPVNFPVIRPAVELPASPLPASAAATSSVPVQRWIWLAGFLVCGAFFLISYLRGRRAFSAALPVEDEGLRTWLAERKLRRTVSLRQSDRVTTPLTYGLLRPVILLPSSWAEEKQLPCVLEHELTHIRCLDALWKLVLVLTACIHWFNPLVWCMLVLANRDLELRCDEDVVRRMGLDRRSSYAQVLISLEERKSGLGPFASAFSKNAIEERIVAIMKTKKHSILVILAAVLLVCCVVATAAPGRAADQNPLDEGTRDALVGALQDHLATLDGAEGNRDALVSALQDHLAALDSEFTLEEQDWLLGLYADNWETMTVSAYQKAMWDGRDTPEAIALVDRYAKSAASLGTIFDEYFYQVYEPLTAEQWQTRSFDGAGYGGAEYTFCLTILDPDALTAGQYKQTRQAVETALRQPMDGASDAYAVEELSTNALRVEVDSYLPGLRDEEIDAGGASDADLHAQFSQETSDAWDEVLAPYLPFGLTYEFSDPDHDGNGLTMWFQGKAVRGIFDEQAGIWITEHSGNHWPQGAVELCTVYTGGKLTGLRVASEEEQAAFTADRVQAGEEREFLQATREDYDAFLALRQTADGRDARELSLAAFNQRLLDWANENFDAYNRINCDVLWNDYGVALTPDERSFVAVTCLLSGTENGMVIRALHTGDPEEDPGFSGSLPTRQTSGAASAWCDLYYDISYHVSDKSAVTAAERDACVGAMMNAIDAFWRDTDFETLLTMSEADVAAQFNQLAEECSGRGVSINHVTADHIHFEHMDERSHYEEAHHEGHHPDDHH